MSNKLHIRTGTSGVHLALSFESDSSNSLISSTNSNDK